MSRPRILRPRVLRTQPVAESANCTAPVCKLCGKQLTDVAPSDGCGGEDLSPTAGFQTTFVDPETFVSNAGYICGECFSDYTEQLRQAGP